jgi:hypothetical protein
MSIVNEITAPIEVVEQDTTEIEDIADLLGFILPETDVPPNVGQLGVYFNRKVFNGWVKQPSPCCGAASVAGAWNSLCCFHRSDRMALAHTNVLDIYKSMFVELIEKKRSTFERKLGAPIESLIEMIAAKLAPCGKTIGGPKGSSITKKLLTKTVTELATERFTSRSPSAADDMQMHAPLNPLDCIIDLLKCDGFDFCAESDILSATATVIEVPNLTAAVNDIDNADNLENLSEEVAKIL